MCFCSNSVEWNINENFFTYNLEGLKCLSEWLGKVCFSSLLLQDLIW